MKKTRRGFTIVETSLATTFLAVIVVTVAVLIVQITRIYQKGLTLRAINATGQAIVEDVTRIVGEADHLYTSNYEVADGATELKDIDLDTLFGLNEYFAAHYVNPIRNGNPVTSERVQLYGAFCAGDYAYVWNTAEAMDKETGALLSGRGIKVKFDYEPDTEYQPRFMRVPVSSGGNKKGNNVCKQVLDSHSDETLLLFSSGEPVELIGDTDTGLAIYDFSVFPSTQSFSSHQSFVPITFILATRKGGVDILAKNDFCFGNQLEKTGGQFERSDLSYCAVNKFDFSVRTGGVLSKNN